VSWDARAGAYRFRAYTANGQSMDAEGRLKAPDVFEWRMEPPGEGVKIRYEIRIAGDEWMETREGSEPRQFFEMKLKKVR
jgi:hypothetical protein